MSTYSRRRFISHTGYGLLGVVIFNDMIDLLGAETEKGIAPVGPGSKYVPRIKAVVVRRAEEYGMRWPGQIYHGREAQKNYCRRAITEADELGVELDLSKDVIHSLEQADTWVAQAVKAKADGLFIILLDRQEHAWLTVGKAVDSGIPTVVFAPLGTAFTTNTWDLAQRDGIFICSTDDFSQAVFGLKMLKAMAKLREMRFIVLRGRERRDTRLDFFGTRLRYVPAGDFLDEYNRTPETEKIRKIARDYIRRATRIWGASEQDVLNGVKSFVVARNILEREQGDGITMDCLGALGKSKVSLPCISWAKMNDSGVPAACEADLGACVTHALVQFLFDRPGFQQDPVPETSKNLLIGSHCSCPTRLNGFSQPPEPYYISHHHGMRDAVPRTIWKTGQRVTVADVILQQEGRPEMIISAGEVVDNPAVPPAGGCVVAVALKLDGMTEPLSYPGFHQLFFYGDYEQELKNYCGLAGIKPVVI